MEARQVTPQEIQQIHQMMEAKQIPVHVWLPIMHLESGGNVRAHNPHGEDSRGLFQINLQAGPGGMHTPPEMRELDLFDPLVNAQAILSQHWLGARDRIKRMLGFADPADQAAYMYRRGIRPQFTEELDRRVRFYATEGLAGLMERYGLHQADHAESIGPRLTEAPPHQFTPERWMRSRRGERVRPPRQQITPETWMRLPPKPPATGENEAPGWLPNPFARLWWEISQAWRKAWMRVVIVVIGVPLLVVAVVLLFLSPEEVVKQYVKLKTGGMVDLGKEEGKDDA